MSDLGNYKWLASERSPQILVNAVNLIGTREIAGSRHNPTILNWAKQMGSGWLFKTDEVPWCGLFVGYCAFLSKVDYPKDYYRAREWEKFGTKIQLTDAKLGDVLVFSRQGGGHVGVYVGEDKTAFHVLGGNQGDTVKVSRILKSRCTAVRRTPWKIAKPANVRKILLPETGKLSQNEQ
jgi:uncharacterized protein (TIGR02594 family)